MTRSQPAAIARSALAASPQQITSYPDDFRIRPQVLTIEGSSSTNTTLAFGVGAGTDRGVFRTIMGEELALVVSLSEFPVNGIVAHVRRSSAANGGHLKSGWVSSSYMTSGLPTKFRNGLHRRLLS